MKDLSPSWLNRARGSFQRAASNLYNDIANTNLDDKEACRILNNRIMMVMHVLQDLCWVVCCNLKKTIHIENTFLLRTPHLFRFAEPQSNLSLPSHS